MQRRTLSSYLLVISMCIAVFGSERSFPGPVNRLPSPDGRYVLINVDSDKAPHHVLVIKDSSSGVKRQIHSYGRHVSALWSPDGNMLVVNDYAGSDFSKSLLFSAAADKPTVDLGAALLRSLENSAARRELTGNDHVYFAVKKWKSQTELVLRVWGYGDASPRGFSQTYVYSLEGSFRRLAHKSTGGPGEALLLLSHPSPDQRTREMQVCSEFGRKL